MELCGVSALERLACVVSNLILDLDVGNSRTKWMIYGQRGVRGVIDNVNIDDIPAHVGCRPCRVRAACVARESYKSALQEIIYRHWGCVTEFACSTTSCAGLTNGYEIPAQLGIDRWLAALAAWSSSGQRPSLIIDAGSALTLDTVDDQRCFLGGYIVPGISMMQKSVISGTGNIRCAAGLSDWRQFSGVPRNTAQAVQQGAAFAVCATVEKAVGNFLIKWPHGEVYITGGDGAIIAHALGLYDRYDQDLVLKGLSLALP